MNLIVIGTEVVLTDGRGESEPETEVEKLARLLDEGYQLRTKELYRGGESHFKKIMISLELVKV